ncbi:hypothetical protein ACFL7D_01875 [candidate division KSB1 bacterium]
MKFLKNIIPRGDKSEAETKKTVPAIVDFSSMSIQQAVKNEINQHPVTLYSGAGALISGLWMSLLSVNPFMFIVFLGSFGVSSGSFLLNRYFREEHFEIKHVERLRAALREQTEMAIGRLKKDLKEFNCSEGVAQIDKLKEKYESLVSVLEKKLQSGGLAYGRFLGMAEQVYKNALDNLQQVVACLDSISAVNPDNIKSKIGELQTTLKENKSVEIEIEALNDTLEKREERLAEVDNLLRKNILAMTRLDQTAMDISTMQIEKGRASVDMEGAMGELVHLAKQFKDFKPE